MVPGLVIQKLSILKDLDSFHVSTWKIPVWGCYLLRFQEDYRISKHHIETKYPENYVHSGAFIWKIEIEASQVSSQNGVQCPYLIKLL